MQVPSAVRMCASACALLTLAGCAGLSPLEKRTASFSTATTAATVRMTSAYALVEQSYSDAQNAKLVDDYDTKGFDPASYQPFMPGDAMKVRTQLLDGLQQYATLLAAVSGTADIDAIDKQSEALGTSLQSLAKDSELSTLAANAKVASGIAASAVDALGRLLVQHQTAKDLPTILESMKKPVDDICQLLAADIGTPDGYGLRNQIHNDYQQLIIDQRKFIADNKATLSPPDRRAAIEDLPQLVSKEKQDDATLAATADALTKLAAANDALVDTRKDKDAPAFHALLSEFVAQGEQIGKVYSAASKSSTSSSPGGGKSTTSN